MSRIAVISAILENPKACQLQFNEVIAGFRGNTKGRMGIPLDEEISVVSIVVMGTLDEINSLTGKLGKIKGVTAKTAIAKKEVEEDIK